MGGVSRPEGHFGGPAREAWQGKQRAAKNFNCLDYRRKTRAEACPPNTLTLSDHRSRIPNGQLNKRAAPIKERVEIRKMQNVYFQNLLVEEFPESSWIFQAVGGQITQLAISIWRVDHWTERLFQLERNVWLNFLKFHLETNSAVWSVPPCGQVNWNLFQKICIFVDLWEWVFKQGYISFQFQLEGGGGMFSLRFSNFDVKVINLFTAPDII